MSGHDHGLGQDLHAMHNGILVRFGGFGGSGGTFVLPYLGRHTATGSLRVPVLRLSLRVRSYGTSKV